MKREAIIRNLIDGEKGMKTFKSELTELLNRYGYDSKLDMHDFVLADFITKCLENLFKAYLKVKDLKNENN